MNIIGHKKIFVGVSLVLVIAALIAINRVGIKYNIDFTGGSLAEVSYQERPEVDVINQSLQEAGFDTIAQPFGESSYLVKTKPTDDEGRRQLIAAMTTDIDQPEAVVEQFNSIGPSVGHEISTKLLYAFIAVSIGIVLFIAYAFRGVSKPVSSWKYGLVAILALMHDIIIPVGILTVLGTEVGSLYVVGLLSILGLSVNDTIVVFDRIRENLEHNAQDKIKQSFDDTVNDAINQTFTRSILTSLTIVIVLLALYYVGPVATQTLSLVLLLGTIFGTYSSIFLASPLLTMMVPKSEQE